MTKRIYTFSLLILVLLLCASMGGTYALMTKEVKTTDVVTTTKLSIDAVQKKPSGSVSAIYPGDKLQYGVGIKNTGDCDAIVRMQAIVAWENAALGTDNVTLAYTSEWADGGDGYYYYKKILAPNQETGAPLFDSLSLDAIKTNNAYQGQELAVSVNMDAVTSTGNAVSMWGKTYSDLGITEPSPAIGRTTGVEFVSYTTGFKVTPSAAGYSATDLFDSFKDVVPGETRLQKINLTNSSDREQEFFLRAEYIDQESATQSQLANLTKFLNQYAKITVKDGSGAVIYSGGISGNTDSGSKISLGKIAKDAKETLSVTLSVDAAADNSYQGLTGQVRWVVIAEGQDLPTPTPTGSGGKNAAKTGDDRMYGVLLLEFFGGLLVFATLTILYKRSKIMESEKNCLNEWN